MNYKIRMSDLVKRHWGRINFRPFRNIAQNTNAITKYSLSSPCCNSINILFLVSLQVDSIPRTHPGVLIIHPRSRYRTMRGLSDNALWGGGNGVGGVEEWTELLHYIIGRNILTTTSTRKQQLLVLLTPRQHLYIVKGLSAQQISSFPCQLLLQSKQWY